MGEAGVVEGLAREDGHWWLRHWPAMMPSPSVRGQKGDWYECQGERRNQSVRREITRMAILLLKFVSLLTRVNNSK